MRRIGVFDSGVGGLTVLAALREHMPQLDYVYLGDTARLPYGTRTGQTVTRYALQAAAQLQRHNIDLLVIACNTASAVALPALQKAFAPVPVVGVIEPGAHAAVRATATGHIGVVATESTIRGGAYQRAIVNRLSRASVWGRACGLFVALAEEGRFHGPMVEAVVADTLAGWRSKESLTIDTLVLGCTHFPPLTNAIKAQVGTSVTVVDSAQTTAKQIAQQMSAQDNAGSGNGSVCYLATDGVERFVRVARHFLGAQAGELATSDVELVNL